jgi:hypothetical protein
VQSARPRPTTLQPPLSNGKIKGCYYSCILLMMGGKTPGTCYATHKRQVINLWNCCIFWLICLKRMMMHVLANVKYVWKLSWDSTDNNRRLLVQLYAPDDGRRGPRNVLSHTKTSRNKLVKLSHLVSWFIWSVWWYTDSRTSNKITVP